MGDEHPARDGLICVCHSNIGTSDVTQREQRDFVGRLATAARVWILRTPLVVASWLHRDAGILDLGSKEAISRFDASRLERVGF